MTYPIEGVAMAKEASLEVEVTLTVRAVVSAEFATCDELRRFIEREQDAVRGAVAGAVKSRMREAGWLDDDRVVFVTEITDAEPANTEYTDRRSHDDLAIVR